MGGEVKNRSSVVVCTCVYCGPLSVLCSGGLFIVVGTRSPINGVEILDQQYEHKIILIIKQEMHINFSNLFLE